MGTGWQEKGSGARGEWGVRGEEQGASSLGGGAGGWLSWDQGQDWVAGTLAAVGGLHSAEHPRRGRLPLHTPSRALKHTDHAPECGMPTPRPVERGRPIAGSSSRIFTSQCTGPLRTHPRTGPLIVPRFVVRLSRRLLEAGNAEISLAGVRSRSASGVSFTNSRRSCCSTRSSNAAPRQNGMGWLSIAYNAAPEVSGCRTAHRPTQPLHRIRDQRSSSCRWAPAGSWKQAGRHTRSRTRAARRARGPALRENCKYGNSDGTQGLQASQAAGARRNVSPPAGGRRVGSHT